MGRDSRKQRVSSHNCGRIAVLFAAIAIIGFCLTQTGAHWPSGSGGWPAQLIRPVRQPEYFSPPSAQTWGNTQPPLVHLAPVPQAPISLMLIGTCAGWKKSLMRASSAFVGTSPVSPRTYQAGALLANNARLREIYSDYVVLERDGNTTRLYAMGKRPADFLPTHSTLLTVGGPTRSSPAVADSHDALTDFVRVSQAFEGDSFSGLIVFANPRSDLFSRLGFQAGDIITAIDGTTFSDPVSATAALHALLNGQTLMVTIRRDDQSSTFPVDGSLLSSDKRLGSECKLNAFDN